MKRPVHLSREEWLALDEVLEAAGREDTPPSHYQPASELLQTLVAELPAGSVVWASAVALHLELGGDHLDAAAAYADAVETETGFRPRDRAALRAWATERAGKSHDLADRILGFEARTGAAGEGGPA